jgi:hypothetical protein
MFKSLAIITLLQVFAAACDENLKIENGWDPQSCHE